MSADRVRRKMTWVDYVKFLGMPMATVQKIVRGVTTTPHELTQEQLTACFKRSVDDKRPYNQFRPDAARAKAALKAERKAAREAKGSITAPTTATMA